MYGFKIKRAEQAEGVKRIAKMSDYAKKYEMIKVLLEKMFKVSRLFLNLPSFVYSAFQHRKLSKIGVFKCKWRQLAKIPKVL